MRRIRRNDGSWKSSFASQWNTRLCSLSFYATGLYTCGIAGGAAAVRVVKSAEKIRGQGAKDFCAKLCGKFGRPKQAVEPAGYRRRCRKTMQIGEKEAVCRLQTAKKQNMHKISKICLTTEKRTWYNQTLINRKGEKAPSVSCGQCITKPVKNQDGSIAF